MRRCGFSVLTGEQLTLLDYEVDETGRSVCVSRFESWHSIHGHARLYIGSKNILSVESTARYFVMILKL